MLGYIHIWNELDQNIYLVAWFFPHLDLPLGVSRNKGTPKWIVFNGKPDTPIW